MCALASQQTRTHNTQKQRKHQPTSCLRAHSQHNRKPSAISTYKKFSNRWCELEKNRKKSNSIIIINAMTLFLFGIKFYIYILHVIIVLEISFAAVDLSVRQYSRKIKMEIFYLFLMTKRTNYVFSFECVWVHIGKRSKREWISWKW